MALVLSRKKDSIKCLEFKHIESDIKLLKKEKKGLICVCVNLDCEMYERALREYKRGMLIQMLEFR